MDILIHRGDWRHLRTEIGARGWILLTAIGLDAMVIGAFAVMQWHSDPANPVIALASMTAVLAFERVFLRLNPPGDEDHDHGRKEADDPKATPPLTFPQLEPP
ncbi:hypothetical protein [Ruegeria marina]|nr:hypothetical protein [Ruegeria marina]